MVKSCCAVGCSNRFAKGSNIKFYRFPTDPIRRTKWIAAVDRKDWVPTESTWICSEHFVTGSKSNDPLSPAFVPSIFLHIKSPTKRKASRDLKRYKRRKVLLKEKLERMATTIPSTDIPQASEPVRVSMIIPTRAKMAAKKSMKALVKENKEKSYTFKDVPVPVPGPGDLLVRPTKVGLCGSDIHFYDWTSVADTVATIPFTPGHEMVAEIVSVGPDVPEEYSVGKRVCVENHFFCGKCYQCKNDQKHICQNMKHYGLGKGTSYGGLSEMSILPARYAYILKTDISDEEAVLLEPFGVAHQAVESISVKGETVLVLGCGPVGLFAAGIAKCMGASKVIAADLIENRLEKAKVMGADILINSKTENLKERVYQITDGVGVGCLFEATGVPAVVNSSFELLRKGSSIILIGLPTAPVQINDPIDNLIRKALTLKAICGRKIFHTWEQSEMMIHRKEFPVLEAVSHDFALRDFEEAFRVLVTQTGCKVLISPNKA